MITSGSETTKVLQAVSASHDPRPGDDAPDLLTETLVQRPSLYKVLMLNDDYTPMEFVVHVLQRFFAKTLEEATSIMLQIHHTGAGLCGVYTLEVAETKVAQVMAFVRNHQHPLQCTVEKD